MNALFWPNSKSFAFTIIDDTDESNLENVPKVYDYLYSKRILTTKSVWVRDGDSSELYNEEKGTTLQDAEYLNWVKSLRKKGFEICLHSISWSASTRDQILAGFDFFENLFGKCNVLVQHNDHKPNESIYWGSKRLIIPLNYIYEIATRFNPRGVSSRIYQGEKMRSDYFWGDICKNKVEFIRSLVFPEINLFNITPYVIYKRKWTPYVNNWFISSEAPDVTSFVNLLSSDNIENLANQNGLCIIYTHFGDNFVVDGVLNESFKRVIDDLSQRNGWFVPASEIFSYLEKKNNGIRKLTYSEEFILSWKWLKWKIFHGTS
ncbi:MAG: hypothetical protein JXB49_13050 [Bacteroidales bacterium]|nr:hypothetical protein [Bacteroidales bacterium]